MRTPLPLFRRAALPLLIATAAALASCGGASNSTAPANVTATPGGDSNSSANNSTEPPCAAL